MTHQTKRALAIYSWLVVAGTVLTHGTASATTLSVCIDSASATAARDQHLAEAVAKQEGVQLHVTHFDGGGDDDGFAAENFKALLATKCQLVMGYPVDAANGVVPQDLMATRPYGQTGFVLVVPHGSSARSLADLAAGTKVAVTYETAPDLYFADYPNVRPDVHTSDEETLQTVASGTTKAAMVWGPTVASYIAKTPGAPQLGVFPLSEPHARWNIVALYAPQGTEEAARFEAGALKVASKTTELADNTTSPPSEGGLPALYTAAQAFAGAQKYAQHCAQCHGPHLKGAKGPTLVGPYFLSAKANFAVGDIFSFVSQNMPATQPGSLPHDDYVQIMAFLLQQNGYPPGKTELTFDGASDSEVPLIYQGK